MTYAALAIPFVVVALLVLAALSLGTRPDARWWLTTAVTLAVLLGLTAVFDSLMIAADLFRYDEATLTGVRVLLVPVEDFAWPLASAAALPALWAWLGRRPTRRRGPR